MAGQREEDSCMSGIDGVNMILQHLIFREADLGPADIVEYLTNEVSAKNLHSIL